MFVYLGKYILSAREVEWKQGKCGCDICPLVFKPDIHVLLGELLECFRFTLDYKCIPHLCWNKILYYQLNLKRSVIPPNFLVDFSQYNSCVIIP